MKHIKTRLLSILLALAMLAGLMPGAYAAEDTAYRFGTAEYYSTSAPGETIKDSFYYTDEWFSADPAERNDALALVSMQLSAAAVEADENGFGAKFLKDLGFGEVGFSDFESSDPEDCNYTWAKKTVGGSALVAVVVQSYAFDSATKLKGWTQNFLVNGQSAEGEHYALNKAADKVIDDIAALGGEGNVKYWIMGQSRGGALANLIAAKLSKKQSGPIYAYTFESPATIAEAGGEGYGFIHNYVCSDDIVTMIPPWGMARYGTDYKLNTDETNEQLQAQLEKLGSPAAKQAKDYDPAGEAANTLIGVLTAGIPTRADYSAVKTDTFTDAEGNEVSVTYVYQNVFAKLMGIIFGGGLEGFSADALIDELVKLAPVVDDLAKAMREDSDAYYYQAAKGLAGFMGEMGLSLPLNESELYALLKLAAPLLVDPSAGSESEPVNADTLMMYLVPFIMLYAGVGNLTLSHHFDSVIARLKTLAGAPEMEKLEISFDAPAAGEALDKTPKAVADAINERGESWLTAEAEWDTDDKSLNDNKVYYLNITLSAVGHSIPEDWEFKVNGNKPVKMDVGYEKGASIVTGAWEFAVGTPKTVTVSFNNGGHGETPKAVKVATGSKLKYTLTPAEFDTVTEGNKTWKFKGWYDPSGTIWEDVFATSDLTLTAKWARLMDKVAIFFPIPHVGDDIPAAYAPQGSGYTVTDSYCSDENWSDVFTVTSTDPLTLSFNVSLTSENSEFALVEDEWGFFDYVGTFTVNGEEVEVIYDEDGDYLRGDYVFTPLPASTTVVFEPNTYNVTKGADSTWTKESKLTLDFTVERNEEDDKTFSLFKSISVDGTEVKAENYTAESGSLKVSLKAEYLETLTVGNHKIVFKFEDGSAETKFEIKAAGSSSTPGTNGNNSPKTGDFSSLTIWMFLMISSLAAIFVVEMIRRRNLKALNRH